jgi:hypothetical protein
MKAEGEGCPWQEYLSVLPGSVYTPTSPTFPYSDIESVSYNEAREQIDLSTWIASSNYEHLCSDGLLPEGTSESDFFNTITVVHSRTFSVPAKDRPSGLVRLLMPGVDLLNHAGDVDLLMCDGGQNELQVIPTDGCRWDLVPKIGGEYLMCVSAVRDLVRGEEVTLSYGERSNDDFFVHYGFVPPRNPHDTVRLFEDMKAAAEWVIEYVHTKNDMVPSDELVALYERICSDTDDTVVADRGVELEFIDAERLRLERSRINLQSRGRVDERLVEILERIHTFACQYDDAFLEKDAFIRECVSQRAFDLLREMRCCFLDDLEALISRMPDEELHDFNTMKMTYERRIHASPWGKALQGMDWDSRDDPEETDLSTLIFRTYKQLVIWQLLLL